MGQSHPNPICLFFSILKRVSFKKLNGVGRLTGMGKFPNPSRLHFIFVFIFYFLVFYICFFKIFIILKLIYFIIIKIL